jgi:hypothetical protein
MQTAQEAILQRISVSRGTSEPAQAAPTEVTEVVNVSEDAPIESEADTELQAAVEVEQDVEEPEGDEPEVDHDTSVEDELFYDLDGEEVSQTQLRQWKNQGLMQSDYTRKTQAHSEDVKSFSAKSEQFAVKESEFNDKLLTLEAMLSEEAKTTDEIAEMREYDPESYIKYTERQQKLRQFVDTSKSAKTPSVDMAKVSSDLFAAYPQWMENGKQTKAFTDDTNLMSKYAETRGIGQKELSSFEAKHYQVLLDAAKYSQRQVKNAVTEKAVRKAPVTTKPRGSAQASLTDYDKAKKAFDANPTLKNAVALRKIPKPN